MKVKNLVKLICLLLVVIVLAVWAFGANVSLFGKKFIGWDQNMIKGSDIGKAELLVYTISAPSDQEDFNVTEAANKAVQVIGKRAELLGYNGAKVQLKGDNQVLVTLPYDEVQQYGGVDLFAYNGKAEFKYGETVWRNDDIKKAKITGLNDSNTAYCVEVTLNGDKKDELKAITEKSAYTINATIDSTKVTATLTSADVIKNGKMVFEFTDVNKMAIFEYILNSGEIEGTIALSESSVVNGTGGANVMMILGIAALVIIVLAAIYFIVSNRMLGVAASLSMLIAVLALEFYAATFSWLLIDAAAVAGLAVALMLIIGAHAVVLQSVSKQYAAGKDVISALDSGLSNVRNMLLELGAIAMVAGAGFWIGGTQIANFGIAILGGGFIAAVTAAFILKFIAKIFIGLGADSAKALGLKRGE